jgi:hypothetical protein
MRRVAIVALAITAALIAGTGFATARARFETSAIWGYSSSEFGDPAFLGEVDSPNQACRGPRRVEMHRIHNNRDRVVGETHTTAGRYDWRIESRDPLPRGRYYVRVPRREIGRDLCAGYHSRPIPSGDIS